MQIIIISMFLVLPMIVIAIAGILFWAISKEAFASRGKLQRRPATVSRLPLLRGGALRAWAADWSKSLVKKHAGGAWTRETAAAVGREVEAQASFVIDRVLPPVAARHSICLDYGAKGVRVTVPEALAIADELHARLPAADVRRIMRRAHDNEVAADQEANKCPAGLCPLLGDDGHCLAFGTRPLQCRGRCGLPCDRSTGPAATSAAEFSATVSDAMQQGLATALTAAGFDGHRYELNQALAAVLDEPETVDRWTRGEALLMEPAGR
ncbi:MAG TPA: hypothetical protein VNH11_04340 [Pirellulales bacterium]|nr:hypothetical protein [Pirellulales bacterium]